MVADPMQPGLFDNPPPRARRTDPDTSHAAANSMAEGAKGQRSRIHAYLTEFGPHTADELDEALDLRVTSAGRRLSELKEKGLAERTTEKRPTRSGRGAYAWRAL